MARRPDRFDQRVRKQVGGPPARGLKQREKRRQRFGLRVFEQDGKDRQALRVVVGREMPDQRDLRLGADPALNPVAPHQQHERGAALQGRLQTLDPFITDTDRRLVAKDPEPRLLQSGPHRDAGRPVSVAVAQKNLIRCARWNAGHGVVRGIGVLWAAQVHRLRRS